jgi:hypothetical protein
MACCRRPLQDALSGSADRPGGLDMGLPSESAGSAGNGATTQVRCVRSNDPVSRGVEGHTIRRRRALNAVVLFRVGVGGEEGRCCTESAHWGIRLGDWV